MASLRMALQDGFVMLVATLADQVLYWHYPNKKSDDDDE